MESLSGDNDVPHLSSGDTPIQARAAHTQAVSSGRPRHQSEASPPPTPPTHLQSLELSSSEDPVESESSPAVATADPAPSDRDALSCLPAAVDASTVRVLQGPGGAQVWLLGSVHFSERSQRDVALLALHCRPHVLALELCSARAGLLQLDEQALLQQTAGGLSVGRAAAMVRQQGAVTACLHLLLIHLTARLTARLGVVPGGEFRRAYLECVLRPAWLAPPSPPASPLPSPAPDDPARSLVYLADRPIQVTLSRAMSSLGLWQRLRLGYKLLCSDTHISPADLERAKQPDVLDRMLAELAADFPSVGQVFVDERDQFMSASLWHSCVYQSQEQQLPVGAGGSGGGRRVLAVVGIGHLDGIVAQWGRVPPHRYHQLLLVPPASRTTRAATLAIRLSLYTLLLYGASRIFTRHPASSARQLASFLCCRLTQAVTHFLR